MWDSYWPLSCRGLDTLWSWSWLGLGSGVLGYNADFYTFSAFQGLYFLASAVESVSLFLHKYVYLYFSKECVYARHLWWNLRTCLKTCYLRNHYLSKILGSVRSRVYYSSSSQNVSWNTADILSWLFLPRDEHVSVLVVIWWSAAFSCLFYCRITVTWMNVCNGGTPPSPQ